MHRVRVGLTGLAFVFLLVMLATTFLRVTGDSDVANGSTAGSNAAAAPSDTLAELGVAPGNAPTAPASTKPKPAQ
jgi:hypothetical protein